MTVMNTHQRAQELLTLLGEHASVCFEFDAQLTSFRALDEFTRQGTLSLGTTSTLTQAFDPVVVLTEVKDCLRTLLHDASEVGDALRYSRVLDLVEQLSPRWDGQ